MKFFKELLWEIKFTFHILIVHPIQRIVIYIIRDERNCKKEYYNFINKQRESIQSKAGDQQTSGGKTRVQTFSEGDRGEA